MRWVFFLRDHLGCRRMHVPSRTTRGFLLKEVEERLKVECQKKEIVGMVGTNRCLTGRSLPNNVRKSTGCKSMSPSAAGGPKIKLLPINESRPTAGGDARREWRGGSALCARVRAVFRLTRIRPGRRVARRPTCRTQSCCYAQGKGRVKGSRIGPLLKLGRPRLLAAGMVPVGPRIFSLAKRAGSGERLTEGRRRKAEI